MDTDIIQKMLSIMSENELAELEYQDGDKKIRLRKSEPQIAPTAYMGVPPVLTAPAGSEVAGDNEGDVSAEAEQESLLMEVASPLVGTFYLAPKPDAESFVKVGDQVTPDKVLCIVEAMKVMNEIKAEVEGVVKEILVKNGQAVEFNEPLFLIEKVS